MVRALSLSLVVASAALVYLTAGIHAKEPPPRENSQAGESEQPVSEPSSSGQDPKPVASAESKPGEDAAGTTSEEASGTEPATSKIPQISDEPLFIDPAQFMPLGLGEKATVDIPRSSLAEIVNWLRRERKINITIDTAALADQGIEASDLFTDQLRDQAVYLLLDRLKRQGVVWHTAGGSLNLTTKAEAESQLQTQILEVADLLDAGMDMASIIETIIACVHPTSWDNSGGPGQIQEAGDVLFVTQTDSILMEIKGLLVAIRKPGRRTFVGEPPSHTDIRKAFNKKFSVGFRDTPMEAAVQELAVRSGIEIRLDIKALADASIQPNEPVTFAVTDGQLPLALTALTRGLGLDWILESDVVWITSTGEADSTLKVAVYDVRDLCKDVSESDALLETIASQVAPISWDETGGPGVLTFVSPGVLVVTQTDQLHDQVLKLLEMYRHVLRTTKRRKTTDETIDPNELKTVYYRVQSPMAKDLAEWLPKLVHRDTWKSDDRPESKGTIVVVHSASGPVESQGEKDKDPTHVEYSTLIITQGRTVHLEIEEVIDWITHGGPTVRGMNRAGAYGGSGMGGGGGGGMGGGGGGGMGGGGGGAMGGGGGGGKGGGGRGGKGGGRGGLGFGSAF